MWLPDFPPPSPDTEAWPGGAGKGAELLPSLPTPSPHSRTSLRAGTGQPSLFPSSLGVMDARDAHRVTIAKLGCQRHPRPSLETPPQLKGGASGRSKRLYSALTDVPQTSVTPSGGTQSAPRLGPGSVFMSPAFIWQSKCAHCLGRPEARTKAGAAHTGRLVGLSLPEGVMLIRPAGPILHIDGLGTGRVLAPPEQGWPGQSGLRERVGLAEAEGEGTLALVPRGRSTGPSPPTGRSLNRSFALGKGSVSSARCS